MKRVLVFLLLFLFIFTYRMPPNIKAQNGNPSLSETINWLKMKADYVKGLDSAVPTGNVEGTPLLYTNTWELSNPSDCTLVWTGNFSTSKSQPQTTVSLSLRDLNPDRIKAVSTDLGV